MLPLRLSQCNADWVLKATLMGFGLHVWNVDPEKAIPLLQVRDIHWDWVLLQAF